MVYLVIVILLMFLIYRYDYRSESHGKKIWIILMLLIFVLVAGLKYRLGSDTYYYLKFYETELKPISELTIQELTSSRYAPGFVLCCSFFRSLTPDFTLFQIFHALIVCSAVFYFLIRNAQHLFFALLLFFFFQYTLFFFEQIRESMAVAMFLFAWPSFVKRQWWKWYLWCLLALMFHISSVVLLILPVITLPGVRGLFVLGSRIVIICVAILLFGFIVQTTFFRYIQYLELAESITERAESYSRSRLSGSTFNIFGVLSYGIIYVLYPAISLFFNHKNSSDKKSHPCDSMVLMSIFVSLFSITVAILGRYNNYFYIFSILCMSDFAFTYIPVLGKKIRLKFLYWILLFVPLLGLNLNNRYLSNLNKSGSLKGYMLYYPYSSYLDKTIDKNREACIKYGRKFNR